MLNSRQRAQLRGMANDYETILQIGKGGITDNLLKTLSDALEAHELIKVTILDNAEDTPRAIAENVAELLGAICVTVIGRKAIFYRYSSRDKFAHLEF